jgi:hypothetical protein
MCPEVEQNRLSVHKILQDMPRILSKLVYAYTPFFLESFMCHMRSTAVQQFTEMPGGTIPRAVSHQKEPEQLLQTPQSLGMSMANVACVAVCDVSILNVSLLPHDLQTVA